MILLTLLWLTIPFGLGFTLYLLPQFRRSLSLLGAFLSIAYALFLFKINSPVTVNLLDNFGVSLILDPLAAFFILTNGLVTLAVILYCWQSDKTAFFYSQILILHSSINAAFVSSDLISLYVTLEVISIAAFLLITYPRSDRVLWVGMRYLFVSNV
ncbi:MAG: cation:proton antiporter, partial [Microcystaceae cyanobacterium]